MQKEAMVKPRTGRTRPSSRASVGSLVLTGALLLGACGEPPLEPDLAEDATAPLFKPKCDSPPCNGGGEDPPPPPSVGDATILFTNPIKGKLSYTLYLMDDTGAMMRVLGDSEELNVHNTDPRWAPDAGRFLVKRAFYDRKTGWTRGQLWIADGDGTNLNFVTGPLAGPARWRALDRVVFIDSDGNLVATNLDGSQIDRLTSAGDIQDLVASPDGTRILARVADGQSLRLYTVACTPCAVTSQREISGSDLGLSGQEMNVEDWAHTRDQVLVTVRVGWGNSDIRILDLAGAAATLSPLIVTPVDEYNAAWSHDDSRIVFARYPSATSSRQAGIVIYDLLSDTETEIATSVGPVGIDWRPTAPVE
jgi:hypothetical protein